jgi:hypothetical protein
VKRQPTKWRKTGPGVVDHICNPRYSGNGNWEDYNSRPVIQKAREILISIKKQLGMVVHTCNLCYVEV